MRNTGNLTEPEHSGIIPGFIKSIFQKKPINLNFTVDNIIDAIVAGNIRELLPVDGQYNLVMHPCTDAELEKIIDGLVDNGLAGQIISLNLTNNQLSRLPESIGQLRALVRLSLMNNNLTTLPESFGLLEALEDLNLHNNQLTKLPESFGQLKALVYLCLEKNKLCTLPKSFGLLKALKILSLEENQLIMLPESFGLLKALEMLILRYNNLNTLPESFGELRALKELDLSNNQLTTLPESFGLLKALEQLGLWNLGEMFPATIHYKRNQLTTLPESFGQLRALMKLYIDNNQLTTLPIAAIKWHDSVITKHNTIAPLLDQLRCNTSVFVDMMQGLIDAYCFNCQVINHAITHGENETTLEYYHKSLAAFESVFSSKDLFTLIFQFVCLNDKQVTPPNTQFLIDFLKTCQLLPSANDPNRQPVAKVLDQYIEDRQTKILDQDIEDRQTKILDQDIEHRQQTAATQLNLFSGKSMLAFSATVIFMLILASYVNTSPVSGFMNPRIP